MVHNPGVSRTRVYRMLDWYVCILLRTQKDFQEEGACHSTCSEWDIIASGAGTSPHGSIQLPTTCTKEPNGHAYGCDANFNDVQWSSEGRLWWLFPVCLSTISGGLSGLATGAGDYSSPGTTSTTAKAQPRVLSVAARKLRATAAKLWANGRLPAVQAIRYVLLPGSNTTAARGRPT